MPPTPQHSQPHPYPPHMSIQGPSQPYPSGPYSFDSPQHSLSQPAPASYAQSFPNGPVSNPGYARSFGDKATMSAMRGPNEEAQIYTAVYSGVSVYEMEIGGVAVMRRRSDGWLNATQILKVAGVDKGKRTKVLEKEILTGEHEKVQGGYGKYQGTWISYRRGREFCRQYGVEDVLRPLLEYDVNSDGTSGQSQQDTPTKEQAMAAQRKKFYSNSSLDPRANGMPGSNGTFFSNISPTTSVALAAMNKAARINSPAPRTGGTPKPANMRRPSQEVSSQQSAMSESDAQGGDSGYNTLHNGEPPRKRMRPDSQEGMGPPGIPLDASMRSATPTEPNQSFLYENALLEESVNANGEPIALAPLPTPTSDEAHEKMNLILDLFAEQSRVDYTSHRAFHELSGEDFNMPLDASANNALHWAATLAKVPLLKLLIQRGASVWRGNAAGQSPLISAVLVNNCWEHSCFPEILELLGPLIETRDLTGRTVLHHIAVSSGIKGRAPSSKYYLEALLEFLVRNTSSAARGVAAAAQLQSDSQQTNGESSSQDTSQLTSRRLINLPRFIASIVNARDKAGNTALNLVARIGNLSIINQLIEIHADPTLPNNKGVCANDFGNWLRTGEQPHVNGGSASQQSQASQSYPMPSQSTLDGEAQVGAHGNEAEVLGQEVITSMTSMLTQNLASHKEGLRLKNEQIDKLNEQIRELSTIRKTDHDNLQEVKERVKLRAERIAKVANLRREIERKKAAAKKLQNRKSIGKSGDIELQPEWMKLANLGIADGSPTAEQQQLMKNAVPSRKQLQARLNAYAKSNAALQDDASRLKAKSSELESLYRRVVALCTGVPEEKVDESLPALLNAIESEKGGLGEQEVGRVRDFLRRVDGSRAPPLDSSGTQLVINPTITAAAERAAVERASALHAQTHHAQVA